MRLHLHSIPKLGNMLMVVQCLYKRELLYGRTEGMSSFGASYTSLVKTTF